MHSAYTTYVFCRVLRCPVFCKRVGMEGVEGEKSGQNGNIYFVSDNNEHSLQIFDGKRGGGTRDVVLRQDSYSHSC
jgi:hypothetical protein